ncbi:MAG: class I SAM-dependent methyltransferase [Nanoarchaeota archaeon]
MTLDNKLSNEGQYDRLDFERADQGFPDMTRDVLYSRLAKSDLEGRKLLDIGCGYGLDLEHFAQQGCEVYGIDSSQKMIDKTRKKCPTAELVCASVEEPFFHNEQFDYIISRYAIQHAENVGLVLQHARNVLKKGGELVIMVTHPIRQYFEKKTKDYWKKEVVQSKILWDRLVVEEPSHTFEEYLEGLKGMEYIYAEPIFDPAAEAIKDAGKYPSVLLLHYRKL